MRVTAISFFLAVPIVQLMVLIATGFAYDKLMKRCLKFMLVCGLMSLTSFTWIVYHPYDLGFNMLLLGQLLSETLGFMHLIILTFTNKSLKRKIEESN